LGNYSKRERRRQHILEAMSARTVEAHSQPLCHCGAPAKYEVNRPPLVTFVCAKHVPEDL
jgi:hypothetical protein